jgi:hypothetical protein
MQSILYGVYAKFLYICRIIILYQTFCGLSNAKRQVPKFYVEFTIRYLFIYTHNYI